MSAPRLRTAMNLGSGFTFMGPDPDAPKPSRTAFSFTPGSLGAERFRIARLAAAVRAKAAFAAAVDAAERERYEAEIVAAGRRAREAAGL
ncbi:hypothetical protein [Streptomyces globisporus]|uniref:hypothetical protein n=1 Tax=Streptomyces globisporus TaxID=1908 RepID=UPI0037C64F58